MKLLHHFYSTIRVRPSAVSDPNGLFGCNILVEKTRNFKAGGKVAEIAIPLKVKVDVEIDDVGEDREETVGALVGFVPKVGADGSDPSAEWIKSLRPVVFRCESEDLLPSDELVPRVRPQWWSSSGGAEVGPQWWSSSGGAEVGNMV